MSNKTVEIISENCRMALTHEPPVFECTPQLEAVVLLANKWGFAVYFNMPLVSGGLEQIEYLSHPAGQVVLNHEVGVVKIYENGEFKDAAAMDFEMLVLTMMNIWKNARRQEPQPPPAAANPTELQEKPEAIVKRIKKGVELMDKGDCSLPLWGIADAIRQQMEYHQKNMGTSGESPDWEAGFTEGLKHTLTLIDLGVKAGVEQMKNDDLIADESLLAEYWNSPEEDAAWAHLQKIDGGE